MLDADALAVSLLADLAPTVRTVLPRDPALPAVRVQRVAGEPSTHPTGRDAPRVQVDVWAATQTAAYATADAVVERLSARIGTAVGGAILTGARVLTARSLPDPDMAPAVYRYTLDVRLHVADAVGAV